MKRNLIDELNGTSIEPVAQLAYKVIDTVQDNSAAEQVNTLAMLYLLIAEHYDVNVRHELERAENIIVKQRKVKGETFRALEAYIKGELK